MFEFEDEIWKPITSEIIPGLINNKYIASNYGYISNIDYCRHGKVYSAKYTGQFKNRGYINLTNENGKGLLCVISRIVAKLFCPGYAPGLEVNHKDGNPKNDYYLNLEWCTRKENIRHAYDNKLIKCLLNEELVRSICYLLQEDKLSAHEIACETGLYQISENPIGLISAIKKKKIWSHISNEYEIPIGRHGRILNDTQINNVCKEFEYDYNIDYKILIDKLGISVDKDFYKYEKTFNAIKQHKKYINISKNYSF